MTSLQRPLTLTHALSLERLVPSHDVCLGLPYPYLVLLIDVSRVGCCVDGVWSASQVTGHRSGRDCLVRVRFRLLRLSLLFLLLLLWVRMSGAREVGE